MREGERILTVEESAGVVPLSARQLYRVARRGGGPFRKVEGRWMAYEDELHAWVRSHAPRERSASSADPMPGPSTPRRSGGSLRSTVVELDARRRAA